MTATPTSKTCAALLTAQLTARGMSIRALATKARLSYSYTQRMISGEIVPSYVALGSLARALEVPLQPLLHAAAHDRIRRYTHNQTTVLAEVEHILATTTSTPEYAACA